MTTFAEVEHNSPFSNETDDERRSRLRTVVAASLLGTTVEWYDFFLYATAASLVFNQLFFPNQSSFVGTMLSFATFAVGFLVRPIGGVVFGHIGDRIGRKKTLALTMFIMGIATALMGVLPTAAQIGVVAPILLLLLRILQGFALGGEWAGAVLLAVEHSPEKKRGLFGSIPQIGLALGLALGTGMFALLQTAFDDEQFLRFGWRIAFVLSLVLVIVGLVVRLKVDETPAFQAVRDLERRSSAPLREVFQGRVARNTVLGMLSRWGEGAAFNTWGVFAITYATKTLHFEKVPVLLVVTVAAVVMAILLPFSGLLTDRFGPQRVYIVGIAAYGLAIFPAFALFGTENLLLFGVRDGRGLRSDSCLVLRRPGNAVCEPLPHRNPVHRVVGRLPVLGYLRLRRHTSDSDGTDRRQWRFALAGMWISGGHLGDQRRRHCGDQEA